MVEYCDLVEKKMPANSYLAPVAQSLLNHKIGDQVEFEIHGVRHHHRIDTFAPWKPLPLPAAAEAQQCKPSTMRKDHANVGAWV